MTPAGSCPPPAKSRFRRTSDNLSTVLDPSELRRNAIFLRFGRGTDVRSWRLFVVGMNPQAIVHFAGFQRADAQSLSVLAALIHLVGRQIFGLNFVVAVFHVHGGIEAVHWVEIAGI